jgi:hypothetical protein
MNSLIRRVLAIAIAASVTACATMTLPVPPAEQAGSPAAIALVAGSQAPKSNFSKFVRSKGAAEGAATWAAAMAAGSLAAGPIGIFLMPYFVAVGATAGAVTGAVTSGGSGTFPASSAELMEARVDGAARELDLSPKTVLAVADEARHVLPQRVDVLDPATEAGQRALASHLADGYSGLIELRVTQIGFVGGSALSSNVAFFMVVKAQYFDPATGRLALGKGLVYQSEPLAPREWVRDGGQLLSIEIERAYRALAQRTVESLLLGAEHDWPTSVTGKMFSPSTCGPVPSEPAPQFEHFLLGADHAVPVPVDALAPRLAWRPYVPAKAAKEGPAVRYDLRIWNAARRGPAAPVYERFGLESPEHRVEEPLAPGTTYYWSVRARFERDGQPRATRWSASYEPMFEPNEEAAQANYSSVLKDGELDEVRCPSSSLLDIYFNPKVLWNTCQCLDFIPPGNHFAFVTPKSGPAPP